MLRKTLFFAFLVMPVAVGHGGHGDIAGMVGPSGVDAGGDGAGTPACQDAIAALPLYCAGGLGAVIDVGDLDAANAFALGTCTVTPGPTGVLGTEYAFTCGIDRDDDGLLTNVDAGSQDLDGFDDDFASGSQDGPEVAVCFRKDVGGDWDDVQVVVAAPLSSAAAAAVGSFVVSLELEDRGDCGGGNASAHTHAAYDGAGGCAVGSAVTSCTFPCVQDQYVYAFARGSGTFGIEGDCGGQKASCATSGGSYIDCHTEPNKTGTATGTCSWMPGQVGQHGRCQAYTQKRCDVPTRPETGCATA